MKNVVRATLRLQLHKGFPLDAAIEWVPYYARLGISHLYASPLLCARAGSMHGYDVVDPTRVNPELGGEPALRRLAVAPTTPGGSTCWNGAGAVPTVSSSISSGIRRTRCSKVNC